MKILCDEKSCTVGGGVVCYLGIWTGLRNCRQSGSWESGSWETGSALEIQPKTGRQDKPGSFDSVIM